MVAYRYDIIFAGDFREGTFSSSTTVDQLKAVTGAGYRTSLLQLSGERANRAARIQQDIKQLCDEGLLDHLDPDQAVSAKLLIIADPLIFANKPKRLLQIDAQNSIALVSEGPITNSGRELYDWPTIFKNANETLAQDILWAPMSPPVRATMHHVDPRPMLSDVDWHACIDPAAWDSERNGVSSSKPVIGRSGAPSDQAWPIEVDEILLRYPDDPDVKVRILDGGPVLQRHVGRYPKNWEILTRAQLSERDFLSSIDFFVYSHHPDRIDLIDAALLKAMANGAVAILPPSFEAIFGDAAAYADADQVLATVRGLGSDRKRYMALSEAGKRLIEEQYGPQHFVSRVADVIGRPKSELGRGGAASRPPRSQRRVMFITINGVGMGHLTRMLAIAKRCPPPIQPVFVTMSQGLKVVRDQGYLVEFIPSRQYLDCDVERWNGFLTDELDEMISFYDPSVVIFDGNVPYKGLIDSIKSNPDPWFIWSRRGMWRAHHNDIVGRERHFDVVLEPGDLAASDDHGVTSRYRDRTQLVQPVRLLDGSEMLSRADARAELGLDPEKNAVLIQLGAGNNFDFTSFQNAALAHIGKHHDAQIAVGEWLISDQVMDLPDNVVRMPGYPFARFFNAFDFAISAVGYNSFHELLFAGVPTILVPNEATRQDNQIGRALYADRHGLAVCVRTKEVYRLAATIDSLFEQGERDRIKANLEALDSTNGAAEAASLIEEMVYSRRVDRS